MSEKFERVTRGIYLLKADRSELRYLEPTMSDSVLRETVERMRLRKEADDKRRRQVVSQRLSGRRVPLEMYSRLCRCVDNPSEFEKALDETLAKPQTRLDHLLSGRKIDDGDYEQLDRWQYGKTDGELIQQIDKAVRLEQDRVDERKKKVYKHLRGRRINWKDFQILCKNVDHPQFSSMVDDAVQDYNPSKFDLKADYIKSLLNGQKVGPEVFKRLLYMDDGKLAEECKKCLGGIHQRPQTLEIRKTPTPPPLSIHLPFSEELHKYDAEKYNNWSSAYNPYK